MSQETERSTRAASERDSAIEKEHMTRSERNRQWALSALGQQEIAQLMEGKLQGLQQCAMYRQEGIFEGVRDEATAASTKATRSDGNMERNASIYSVVTACYMGRG